METRAPNVYTSPVFQVVFALMFAVIVLFPVVGSSVGSSSLLQAVIPNTNAIESIAKS